MSKQEFMMLAKGIKAVYTVLLPDDTALDVWYGLLSDLPYDVAAASLKHHMQTSNKLPTPADIRSGAVRLTTTEEMNANEAWDLVSRAVRRSAYYAQEEYDKLPAIVQKAVGSPESLRQMAIDEDYNESVQKSLFSRTFTLEQARETQRRQMSPDLLRLTQNIANRLTGEI